MKIDNKKRLIMYVLIAVLVFTSVAYAALQTTLNVSGAVTKQGNTWNVSFTNLSSPTLTGSASSTNAQILSSSFTFNASLAKPSDSIVYTFDVRNSGSINAKLDAITLTGETIAKTNNITYTLTYADGTAIKVGDKLDKSTIKKLKLTAIFDPQATALSSSDINLNLGATLIYSQAD